MKTKLFQIENRTGRVALDEDVNPWSTKELLDDIKKLYGKSAVEAQSEVCGFTAKDDDALETVVLELNSPGGSVPDGYRIFNALQDMKARGVRVEAVINGKAASMATVIAMAADHVAITKGSLMLVHDASGGVHGTSSDHLKMAKTLEGISSEIATIYAEKTGASATGMRELMAEDRWMTADEASKIGFVDEIITGTTTENAVAIRAAGPSLETDMGLFTKTDDAAAQAKIDSLEADNVEAQSQVEAFKAQVTDLTADLATAQTEVTDLTAQAESHSAELETAKAELAAEQEKTTPEAINALVTAQLATAGHPQAVEVDEAESNTNLRKEYDAMAPGPERIAFRNAHLNQL